MTRMGWVIMSYSMEGNPIRSAGEGAGSKKGGKSTSGKVAVRYHPQYPSSTQPYCAGTQKGPIPARHRFGFLAEQPHCTASEPRPADSRSCACAHCGAAYACLEQGDSRGAAIRLESFFRGECGACGVHSQQRRASQTMERGRGRAAQTVRAACSAAEFSGFTVSLRH